ncbi:Ig-like domain-containing protein [[Bacillus] enclensis]|uniref:Ig-like domain-containing protein n=1 Tax=[Bacillus] enclensis TaxID=1402860 RepID=UPI0018DE9527|nr:Ig-like domain-containing protein [[Bacillus] enclensis]MBH9967927.1 Ig-like domain-containing protein [[Bacillus] enclensis]
MTKKVWVIIFSIVVITGGFLFYKGMGEKDPVTATAAEMKVKEKEKEIIRDVELNPNTNIHRGVKVDKVWSFSFDRPLKKETVTSDIISVTDEEENGVPVAVELLKGGKTLEIKPPEGNYKEGTHYKIYVTEDLSYENGKKIDGPYTLQFITERKESEEAKLNKEIVFVKENQIEKVNEDGSLELDKSVKKNLSTGDIVILHTREYPDGKAIKITTVKSKIGSYIVTVEEPHFAELFEELDIYKTYEITGSEFTLNEDLQGVSVEEVASIPSDTLIASSNSPSKNGEFKLPQVKVESTNGLLFTFKDFPVGKKKSKALLTGSIHVKNPQVETDVKIGLKGIKKMSLVSKSET